MIDDLDASLLSDTILRLLQSHPALTDARVGGVTGDDPVELLILANAWSVSLARRSTVQNWLEVTRAQVRNRPGHAALALAVTEDLRQVQHRRNRVAKAHGLSVTTQSGLDVDAILVDRVNALLLVERHIDPRSLIERHRARGVNDGDLDSSTFWFGRPNAAIVAMAISLRSGDAAPILSSELPIGDGEPMAQICGNVVSISCPLPETLLAASTGRRLGEVVATGIPALDERRVTEASVDGGVTRITLQPDLITIGEARRMIGTR